MDTSNKKDNTGLDELKNFFNKKVNQSDAPQVEDVVVVKPREILEKKEVTVITANGKQLIIG